MNDQILKAKEKIIFSLRNIYEGLGYTAYNVNRFEEYDLYAKNKDFLLSNRVITFTDTDGKLMALKPDVTLSIIKNSKEGDGVNKFYYDESVYRVSRDSQTFKEIAQAGLECLGEVDEYQVYEVMCLAKDSLAVLSDNFALSVSNLDLVSKVIDFSGLNYDKKLEVLECLKAKNSFRVKEICEGEGIEDKKANLLIKLCTIYGGYDKVKDDLDAFMVTDELKSIVCEFKSVVKALSLSKNGDKVVIDFSVVNDMKYYNGMVFSGVIEGVSTSILSGGQYDALMKKMGKKGRAIGFAVYVDLLERKLIKEGNSVDCTVIYDEDTEIELVIKTVDQLRGQGKKVLTLSSAQKSSALGEVVSLVKEDKNA